MAEKIYLKMIIWPINYKIDNLKVTSLKMCLNIYKGRCQTRKFLRKLLDNHFLQLVEEYIKHEENDEIFGELIWKLFVLGFKTGNNRLHIKTALELG